jgi:hypothetical protein
MSVIRMLGTVALVFLVPAFAAKPPRRHQAQSRDSRSHERDGRAHTWSRATSTNRRTTREGHTLSRAASTSEDTVST